MVVGAGLTSVQGVLGAEESRGLEAPGSHPVQGTLRMDSKETLKASGKGGGL